MRLSHRSGGRVAGPHRGAWPDFIVARGAGTRLRRLTRASRPEPAGTGAHVRGWWWCPAVSGLRAYASSAEPPRPTASHADGKQLVTTHASGLGLALRGAPSSQPVRAKDASARGPLLRAADGLPETRGGRTVSTGVAGGGVSGRRRRERVAPRQPGTGTIPARAPVPAGSRRVARKPPKSRRPDDQTRTLDGTCMSHTNHEARETKAARTGTAVGPNGPPVVIIGHGSSASASRLARHPAVSAGGSLGAA